MTFAQNGRLVVGGRSKGKVSFPNRENGKLLGTAKQWGGNDLVQTVVVHAFQPIGGYHRPMVTRHMKERTVLLWFVATMGRDPTFQCGLADMGVNRPGTMYGWQKK